MIKVVSDSGEVAIYNYDEVGNLLSITTQTIKKLPPVLHTISPDVVFKKTFETITLSVTITGENLFTTERVWADDSNIVMNFFTSTDNAITANITISSQASTEVTNINVETVYGSASIPFIIAKVTFTPSNIIVIPGTTIEITAGITPALSRDINLSLNNETPDIISAPQSIVILAGGSTTFTVNALKEGVGVITSENAGVSIYVSTPFTGDAVAFVKPVSVEVEAISIGSFSSMPVSVEIGSISIGSFSSMPVSLQWASTLNGTIMSLPISTKINTQ